MSTVPAPQFHPPPHELDDLELIVSGALSGPLELALPDGVEAAAAEAGAVELVDPEGLPLASVSWPAREVTALARPAYGPFRRLYLTPDEARERHPDGFTAVLGCPIAHPPAGAPAPPPRHPPPPAVPGAGHQP